MSDTGCVVCGAFVGHGDLCPIRYEDLEAENERLRGALTSVAVYRGGEDVARDDRDVDWRLIALRLEDIARTALEEEA